MAQPKSKPVRGADGRWWPAYGTPGWPPIGGARKGDALGGARKGNVMKGTTTRAQDTRHVQTFTHVGRVISQCFTATCMFYGVLDIFQTQSARSGLQRPSRYLMTMTTTMLQWRRCLQRQIQIQEIVLATIYGCSCFANAKFKSANIQVPEATRDRDGPDYAETVEYDGEDALARFQDIFAHVSFHAGLLQLSKQAQTCNGT